MAIGISPQHTEELLFNNLTKEQFLIVAIETAKQLGWNIATVDNTGFIAYTTLSIRSTGEEITIAIENNTATLKSKCIGGQIIDWGKNKKNIRNFLEIFNEQLNTLTIEQIEEKLEILKTETIYKNEESLFQQTYLTKEKSNSFFSIFIPTKGYFVTPIIINLNILFFILTAIAGINILQPDSESLLTLGANFRPLTLSGQWWRLITNCFLHIGIFHLLMNMYALLYIGLLLEPYLGKLRFATAYLLTGIIASLTSIWWHDLTISAGASGAIFGMYGVFLAMLTTNLIEKAARATLFTSIAIFIGYNLMYGVKGEIDNAAHIGGLISGLIIGYAYYPSLKKPQAIKLQYYTIASVAVLFIVTSFIAYSKIPNDIGIYDQKMETLTVMEEKALTFNNLPNNTPKQKLLSTLKYTGIYYWNESIKLLRSLDKLNLPSQLYYKNGKAIQYCELRIKTYELLYKAIDENTEKYKSEIADYNKQIETLLSSLQNE